MTKRVPVNGIITLLVIIMTLVVAGRGFYYGEGVGRVGSLASLLGLMIAAILSAYFDMQHHGRSRLRRYIFAAVVTFAIGSLTLMASIVLGIANYWTS